MTKGRLFEYAVLHHPTPTKDQTERGESPKSELISEGLRLVVAIDEKQVAVLAARSLGDEYVEKLHEVEILVRPFA